VTGQTDGAIMSLPAPSFSQNIDEWGWFAWSKVITGGLSARVCAFLSKGEYFLIRACKTKRLKINVPLLIHSFIGASAFSSH